MLSLIYEPQLPDDTARDSGEALSIRQMIAKAVEKFGVDRNRMFAE